MIQKNKKIEIVQITLEHLKQLTEFHINNHLQETVRFPGELQAQKDDLTCDFPQLYQPEIFQRGYYYIVQEEDQKQIIGCIGLDPQQSDKENINNNNIDQQKEIWLNCFSVDQNHRNKGIGTALIQHALEQAKLKQFKIIKLLTLGKHSIDQDEVIMANARKLYEKFGFQKYKEEKIDKYGENTSVSVLYYQRQL